MTEPKTLDIRATPPEAPGGLHHDYGHRYADLVPPGRRWATMNGGGPFPDLVGPMFVTFDVLDADEPARIGLRLLNKHCNGVNVAHGGMLSAMLDGAFAQCLLAALDVDWNVPTINLVTDFLAPAFEGEWLETRIRLSHSTQRMAFIAGEIRAEDRTIIRGQAIFKITRRIS